ncbi:hypothetical protein [Bilophila wadsworthia]|nr:hypothetical protein [Bilophila wadsworthia]
MPLTIRVAKLTVRHASKNPHAAWNNRLSFVTLSVSCGVACR